MTFLIVLLVILLLVGSFVVSNYNSLVVLRNKVRDQFSQIDVQLKMRADMIPNLVEIVKGYEKHEKGTLEAVIKARNTYLSAGSPDEKMKSSGELTQAINKLFALAENYPDLKANENFLKLQASLEEVEDKIRHARQFYNDAVLMYNNKIEVFPSNFIASIFHFTKESFFEATEDEKKNVEIKF
ncbi:MAG: LemA family protein [Bacilli bacterium]|nr:LemA family protein [Bacilli bacterium]